MKWLISISIVLTVSAAILGVYTLSNNQIQIHGKLIAPENDTTAITVWSDGDMIDRSRITGVFYEMVIGQRPHYTIQYQNGSKIKYCTIICHFMEFESIPIDIDFRNNQSIMIYKKRKNSNSYVIVYYGSGSTRDEILKPYETE